MDGREQDSETRPKSMIVRLPTEPICYWYLIPTTTERSQLCGVNLAYRSQPPSGRRGTTCPVNIRLVLLKVLNAYRPPTRIYPTPTAFVVQCSERSHQAMFTPYFFNDLNLCRTDTTC